MVDFDLIIVGGGAAGFAAAFRSNKLKKRTLLINDPTKLPLGGTCVNVGCLPSKIMLHQGKQAYSSTHSPFQSIHLKGQADFLTALEETRHLVVQQRQTNYADVLQKQEYITYKEGMGRFTNAQTVTVGSESFRSNNILISTGATAYVPQYAGVKNIQYYTNENIFDMTQTPKSMIIIGAGPQGLEMAQMFHHFGIKVTVLQRSNRVLTKFDPFLAKNLEMHLQNEGINILTGTTIHEFSKKDAQVYITFHQNGQDQHLLSEGVFFAAGLQPHTQDLNVEAAGVMLDLQGYIKINPYMQTNIDHVFAAGDVTGVLPLETVAAKQGSFAVMNMYGKGDNTINYAEVPRVVFTSPAVGSVGITEEEYRKQFGTCLCSTVELERVEKAKAIKDTRGVIQMVLDHQTRQIVGIHLVSPMAAEIITTATYAIHNKMTIYDVRSIIHVFPTLSEILKKVAQSFDLDLDTMACCIE